MSEIFSEIFSKNTLYLSIIALALICSFIICIIVYNIIKDRFSRSYNKSTNTLDNIKKIKRHIDKISNIADSMLFDAMNFINEGEVIVLSVEDVKENFDHMKAIIEIQFKNRFGQEQLPFKFLWCCNAFQANKMIPEIVKRGAELKAAICDMDLGITGGDVNDVIKELASRNVPAIIYTGYDKETFEQKILPELKSKVIYQYKGLNKEMADILEHLVKGKLEIVK